MLVGSLVVATVALMVGNSVGRLAELWADKTAAWTVVSLAETKVGSLVAPLAAWRVDSRAARSVAWMADSRAGHWADLWVA